MNLGGLAAVGERPQSRFSSGCRGWVTDLCVGEAAPSLSRVVAAGVTLPRIWPREGPAARYSKLNSEVSSKMERKAPSGGDDKDPQPQGTGKGSS